MKNPFFKKTKNDYNSYDDSYEGGFYREEDEEDGVVGDFEEEDAAPAPIKKPASAHKSSGKFKVVKPHGYQDGSAIVDYLVDGYAVVLNIEELERSAALRLIDFLLGALQVLDGELRRVTKTTLVLSPRPGELSGEDEAEQEPSL